MIIYRLTFARFGDTAKIELLPKIQMAKIVLMVKLFTLDSSGKFANCKIELLI